MLGYYEGQANDGPIVGLRVRGAALNKKTATVVYTVVNELGQNETRIRYHDTDVVAFTADRVVLNTGGWFTVTTKRRMNEAAAEYDLGYSVWQHKGKWFVQVNGVGDVLQFSPGGLASFERGK